ncbi:phosphoribosylamine--glycine ligase [Candidatus Woesearchaeota archaeon]|nr:phosphoribosylamine--glycine ligase [Candidatus Woesearchaeota archaeon]
MEAKSSENSDHLKFLFISHESLSGDLAWSLRREGHDVKIYIKSETDQDVYDGFLDRVSDAESQYAWADVIVFDDTGFGAVAEKLRKEGKAVVGGSIYTDRLEEDREFGQKEMEDAGIAILPHWDFDDYSIAIKFLQENPGRYVYKPSGLIDSEWKGLLFIGQDEDASDLIEVLDSNKRNLSRKIPLFQLQKYVLGVEVAVGAYFNGKEFITPINVNFEHKRLFPGDVGPFTGEMGTLMYWDDPNVLFKETLKKMEFKLAQSGYVGYFDINCIVNARNIYPLEMTCRFGYPTISIHLEGITSPIGKFLQSLAGGEPCEFKTKKGFQVGIVIAVPPFPFSDPSEFRIYRDCSIIFKKPNFDGVHLGDVKMVDGDWKLAGESGYALVVTGSGVTVDEARKQAYGRIKNIILQNMYYRTDIGLRWYTDSDKLLTWGYWRHG